jgi:hypothetical protein
VTFGFMVRSVTSVGFAFWFVGFMLGFILGLDLVLELEWVLG